jgi:radical SAM protein with 4Fe4S-binding SPASM domain
VLLNHHANRRLNKAIEELNLLVEKGYPIRLGVPFSGRCGRFSPCKAGISKLIVRWDGAVFPCEAFKECGASILCLGQAGEQSLSELLSKARENKALIGLRQRVDSLEPCPAQILYQAIENRESI